MREEGRRRELFDATGTPLVLFGGLVFAFLALPVVALFLNLSGSDLTTTYRDPQTKAALLTSLGTATASTLIIAVFGVPLAYLLARYRFHGKVIVNVAVYLPLVLPPVSAGILLLIVYGPYGTLGQLVAPHGITFVDTAAGIVLAQVFVASPYAIVAARSAFEGIEREYEDVACSLGAGTWQTFTHVALPMARSGILAGLTLGWMRALGEFGATIILAYHPYSLPVLNYVNLNSTGLSTALPIALLALLIAGIVLLVVLFVEPLELRRRTAGP